MTTHTKARAAGRRGLLFVVVAACLWGTVGIDIKAVTATGATNALTVGFLRLALSVPFLLAASRLLLGRWITAPARRHLAPTLLFGAMMALYQVCYVLAIGRVGVAIASLVTICTAPVLVALFSAAWLRERLGYRTLAALASALGGTALLVGLPGDAVGDELRLASGVALALGSAAGYAICVLTGRVLARHYHPLESAGLGFALGALGLLPFALFGGLVLSYSATGWALLLYLGAVPTALAYLLFFGALRTVTATAVSIATLIEPLTASLLAMLLFGEQLGPWGLLGATLLLGAIGVLYRDVEAPVAS